MSRVTASLIAILLAATATALAADTPYFRIMAVDRETGRGIPMVRFTVDAAQLHHFTDSRGVIAFYEPGLTGENVCFRVEGHGYEIPPDEHGESAMVLQPQSDGEVVVRLTRRYPAERLYRISGLAPYRDSRLLGDRPPTDRPPLLARIMGQDSVFVQPYHGQLFWIWGDAYTPLARTWGSHYEVTAAMSALPGPDTFDPDTEVDLKYFVGEDGTAKKMVAADDGGSMTWFDGVVTLSDGAGEHLFAHYVQLEQRPLTDNVPQGQINHPMGMWWSSPELGDWIAMSRLKEKGPAAVEAFKKERETIKERYVHVTRGLMKFHDDDEQFHKVAEFPLREADELHIGSHALIAKDGDGEFIWYTSQFPNRRVKADTKAISDIDRYEAFTCLKDGVRFEGARFDGTAEQLDRSADGTLQWNWKKNTSPVGVEQQKQLVKDGLIADEERWIAFRDIERKREITTQHNTIRWNPYRRRYVGIFSERTPKLGEAFYGEADTPVGPWVYLQKVVSHTGVTFYNPCLHFERDAGRTLYFEGTVTLWQGFGETTEPPLQHYDYNQMMYRVSLDDLRLFLPVPMYQEADSPKFVTGPDLTRNSNVPPAIVFFAPDRRRKETVPVYQTMENGSIRLTLIASAGAPAFYAEPPNAEDHSPWTVPLYEFQTGSGERRYSVEREIEGGFRRTDDPVCFVWSNSGTFNPWTTFRR